MESNIKMRLILILFSLLLPLPALCATQNWEVCLDKADFYFSADGFLGSTTVAKTGCKVKFAHSGGKGEKFEIDVCDPLIHVDYFAAIDAESSRRILAGSTGCSAPLFGADFDMNAQDFNDYNDVRKNIFDIWAKVKSVYGEGSDKVNLSNPSSFSPEVSAGKIACGEHLLSEYLTNCMAFEAKKQEIVETTKFNNLGIHPQTILAPKK